MTLPEWMLEFFDPRYANLEECRFLYENSITNEILLRKCGSHDAFTHALITTTRTQSDFLLVAFITLTTALLLGVQRSRQSKVERSMTNVLIYLCSPLAWLASPIAKSHHLIFAFLCNEWIWKQWWGFYALPIAFSLLIAFSPEYILFLPVFTAMLMRKRQSKGIFNNVLNLLQQVCLLMVLSIILPNRFLSFERISSLLLQRLSFSSYYSDFRPTVGVVWYLHALILPGYEEYFRAICIGTIFTCSLVLWILLSDTKHHADLMCLLLIVIQIVTVEGSLVDILLLLFIIAQRQDIIFSMRYLSLTCLGICFPFVISFAMLYLWVKLGTGNANFLFFQGVCSHAFLSLFVIEYVNTIVKEWGTKAINN